jgi:hypothetical protein
LICKKKIQRQKKTGTDGRNFLLEKDGVATSKFNFDRKFKAANIDPEINNCLENTNRIERMAANESNF